MDIGHYILWTVLVVANIHMARIKNANMVIWTLISLTGPLATLVLLFYYKNHLPKKEDRVFYWLDKIVKRRGIAKNRFLNFAIEELEKQNFTEIELIKINGQIDSITKGDTVSKQWIIGLFTIIIGYLFSDSNSAILSSAFNLYLIFVFILVGVMANRQILRHPRYYLIQEAIKIHTANIKNA